MQRLTNVSRRKGNQTMKFSQLIEHNMKFNQLIEHNMKFNQLIEHNMRSIFLEKLYTKYGGGTIPRPFFEK